MRDDYEMNPNHRKRVDASRALLLEVSCEKSRIQLPIISFQFTIDNYMVHPEGLPVRRLVRHLFGGKRLLLKAENPQLPFRLNLASTAKLSSESK